MANNTDNKLAAMKINKENFEDALGQRYASYALSTIMSRSLPDVRDGLKPVHRRLLYAMRELKLNSNSSFKKCARVVGDVIGKFHPHGDQAVYDSMVRLAQEFNVRYPIIDGQGNFGNIDGDNAAAMRYTEARLTQVAELLLEGLDEDAVDFKETYDSEDEEPLVLPSTFPNLLANGASGIAVGMATSIPPHNILEICKALLYIIDYPEASNEELIKFIPGPDFPTGGVLVETKQSIQDAYSVGKGGFRIRAKWERVNLKRGNYQILISEIPFGVVKSRLMEKLEELVSLRKLDWLSDIHDESAEDLRIILEPKSRNIDAEKLMEVLFKMTDLEVKIPLNMNVIDSDNIPKVMPLKSTLLAFKNHRKNVLKRRKSFRLKQITKRIEILDGLLVAYKNIDEIISIIREYDSPKQELIDRWSLSERQTDSILNMRLRALNKLEEVSLLEERKILLKEKNKIDELLSSEVLQYKYLKQEISVLLEKFSSDKKLSPRKTHIQYVQNTKNFLLESIEKIENITFLCSTNNWIRTVKGHLENDDDLKYKDGDSSKFLIQSNTQNSLLIICSSGKVYTIFLKKVSISRNLGEPISLHIDIDKNDKIVSIITPKPDLKLLILSSDGRGFIMPSEKCLAYKKSGKQIMMLSKNANLFSCVSILGDHVALIGENKKLLIFPIKDIPALNKGKGVILQRFNYGGIADVKVFNINEGLQYKTSSKRRKTLLHLDTWIGKKGQTGKKIPQEFPKTNYFNNN